MIRNFEEKKLIHIMWRIIEKMEKIKSESIQVFKFLLFDTFLCQILKKKRLHTPIYIVLILFNEDLNSLQIFNRPTLRL